MMWKEAALTETKAAVSGPRFQQHGNFLHEAGLLTVVF
jgi:hypothetical protein